MATANERRIAVRNQYRKMIGRNHYSQPRRNYALTPYKDGKYYSDCSSSVSYAYKAAKEAFGILNTVGMWTSKKFKDVPVVIKKGIIQNPEVLKIGDILLFAGNDKSRKSYGYVGHVEMVGEISGGKITLYGHGSGLAKKHEMNAYCKSRYNTKASTPLGRRLLIRVRRLIWEGNDTPTTNDIRYGMTGEKVKAMQKKLLVWNAKCLPEFGADGDFGSETETALRAFQKSVGLDETGIGDALTLHALDGNPMSVEATGDVNVRSAPGAHYSKLGTLKKGQKLPYQMQAKAAGATPWYLVTYNGGNGWVSSKYSKIIK